MSGNLYFKNTNKKTVESHDNLFQSVLRYETHLLGDTLAESSSENFANSANILKFSELTKKNEQTNNLGNTFH